MDRLLSEKAVIDAIMGEPTDAHYPSWYAEKIKELPSAEPHSIKLNQGQSSDMISRQAVLDNIVTSINQFGGRYTTEMINMWGLFTQMILQMPSAEPQERKTEKALRLLLEWAIECDFGYDNIPEEYEKYKDDIEGMSYTDGLIYIARKEVDK